MKITAEQHSTATRTVQVVKVDGYLDAHTFPDVERVLRGLLDTGCYDIILDFETLDYISSAGLGLLLGIHRMVAQRLGALKIVNMSESVASIFDVLGFSRIIDVLPDRASALRAFDKNAPN